MHQKQNREIDDHNISILCTQYKDHKEIFLKHSSINFTYENFSKNLYENTKRLALEIKNCFSTKEERWWELNPDSYVKFGEMEEEEFYGYFESIQDSLREENVVVPEDLITQYGDKIKMYS